MPASHDEAPRFEREDLAGARFRTVRLNEALFGLVDLRDARLHQVVFNGTVMRGADLVDVAIDGECRTWPSTAWMWDR